MAAVPDAEDVYALVHGLAQPLLEPGPLLVLGRGRAEVLAELPGRAAGGVVGGATGGRLVDDVVEHENVWNVSRE